MLFLGVVLLDIGLAYIYVVPSLQNRLVHQKLNDLSGNSVLVARHASRPPTPTRTDLEQTPRRFIDTQINARIVVIDAAHEPIARRLAAGPAPQRRQLPGRRRRRTDPAPVTIGEATIDDTRYATAAVPS